MRDSHNEHFDISQCSFRVIVSISSSSNGEIRVNISKRAPRIFHFPKDVASFFRTLMMEKGIARFYLSRVELRSSSRHVLFSYVYNIRDEL